MSPPSLVIPDPHTAYCAALREVLETLLEALEFQQRMPLQTPAHLWPLYDPGWAIDHARTVLAQDATGLEAQAEIALHMGLALLAYEFATYLEGLQDLGMTLPSEIAAGLAHVQALTQLSYQEGRHATA
jgi:hypothetical protein